MSDWKTHVYRVGKSLCQFDDTPAEPLKYRNEIEPWLSAVFQSEHLSLLLGSGLPRAIASVGGGESVDMKPVVFENFGDEIKSAAEKSAITTGRGEANLEDQLRVALALRDGLLVMGKEGEAKALAEEIDKVIGDFVSSVLTMERQIVKAETDEDLDINCATLFVSFLLSFASRAVTRERLNIFTTNYDRLIEHGADLAGIRFMDRFIGTLNPVFRSSRLNIDFHYNPPGIRGEPRYLEGVVRFTKLHGSLDWRYENGKVLRYSIPFGASADHPDLQLGTQNSLIIYPNPAKNRETLEFPYAELFRDFSADICRPNSVLVTYGYGFGDEHINRMIADMLTIPSTHLVIMSYDNASNRIPKFCIEFGHEAQISLLIGSHFGHLPELVQHYLPKPAIDIISSKKADLLRKRLITTEGHHKDKNETE